MTDTLSDAALAPTPREHVPVHAHMLNRRRLTEYVGALEASKRQKGPTCGFSAERGSQLSFYVWTDVSAEAFHVVSR